MLHMDNLWSNKNFWIFYIRKHLIRKTKQCSTRYLLINFCWKIIILGKCHSPQCQSQNTDLNLLTIFITNYHLPISLPFCLLHAPLIFHLTQVFSPLTAPIYFLFCFASCPVKLRFYTLEQILYTLKHHHSLLSAVTGCIGHLILSMSVQWILGGVPACYTTTTTHLPLQIYPFTLQLTTGNSMTSVLTYKILCLRGLALLMSPVIVSQRSSSLMGHSG